MTVIAGIAPGTITVAAFGILRRRRVRLQRVGVLYSTDVERPVAPCDKPFHRLAVGPTRPGLVLLDDRALGDLVTIERAFVSGIRKS